ncbi:hypothetical protein GCM10007862_14540 [Dyella lipolytica]|nr:hypothetical protein GCM10007862_14540 [Dyella lipolytica]
MYFGASLSLNVEAAETRLPGTVELSPMPLDHAQSAPTLTVLGLNANVLTTGSLTFEGGYDPRNWSGILRAVPLNADGTLSDVVWDASIILTDASATPPGRRTILTAGTDSTGAVTGMAFESNSRFDASETEGLMTPVPQDTVNDTMAARVDYLRGVRSEEAAGVMRTRQSLLGAIVDAQTVYVAYPTGNYTDAWPTTIRGVSVPAPEMAPDAQGYDTFVAANANRPPTVYVGANDGMLHAFNAPVPNCTMFDSNGNCSHYVADADAGKELWAYVPRATYGYLGNLTSLHDFRWAPTVDATPVTRDVYFSERGDRTWHTILVGGLRLGGRGVYALDITHPTAPSEVFPERTVLWEFDADAASGTSASGGAYDPADLGFTYGQPAIARLANGRWAVLIPSGYFADCSQPDKPTNCKVANGTPPADYSALFVLDAQTGEVMAELKTPTTIDGATSYGLSSPVLGAYNNDQIDDVAFAGDLAGNLWRFDLSAPNPLHWTVTLAYRPAVQGAQPITTMPRLFPDPITHRFIVVFGTGKYLGGGDNTTVGVPTQSVYGIRDKVDHNGKPITVTRSNLQAQTLSQTVVTDPSDPNAGATLRNLSSHPVPSKADGWYFDLNVTAGERVVVTPSALFNTNTVLVSTLIPDGNAVHAKAGGAVMAVDALTGGPGSAVASFGGIAYAGAVINQAPGAHMLPVATIMGGGKLLLPGVSLKGKKGNLDLPLSFGSPLWRRRSWSVLTQGP